MQDLISRQAAIDAICKEGTRLERNGTVAMCEIKQWCIDLLERLPSTQPEVKEIGYAECANAMLKMWIDNVLTDGEYNRIMDRLNAHHNAGRRPKNPNVFAGSNYCPNCGVKCETKSTHEIVWCTADELSEVGDDRRSISTAIRTAKD